MHSPMFAWLHFFITNITLFFCVMAMSYPYWSYVDTKSQGTYYSPWWLQYYLVGAVNCYRGKDMIVSFSFSLGFF